MNLQLDQAISREINNILTSAQLSPEMLRMISTSLNADNKNGELFKWAHLTLLSCDCVGGVHEVVLPGAIAMEFFALAADIFDDIQDQDNDNLPWRKLPNSNAVNLATCLLMLGYEAISSIPDNSLLREVSQILTRTGVISSDGQYQEFLYDSIEKVSLEQYFEVVKRKSGSLTACACKIGATLGGASEVLVNQLALFGTNLGIMSQIRNDLNDFLSFEKKKDFIYNRKTLPYVYLLTILKGDEADRFKELTQMQRENIHSFGKEEQEFLKRLTYNEGVGQYCTVMYEIFRQKSMEVMMAIPILEKHKEKMIKIVEEII
ncbi:MAG: polyprenyl synthetase family protein [Desulfosporosinus sp.]|nr:polyprenyl synthetase family protein [Desulfosporosinus sp.]